MKRFFIFALVATLFAACSTDATQDVAPEIPTSPDELYVSFDEETSRIQLGENGSPVWTEGDLVSVFYKSDGNDCYKFTGATGDRSGTLMRTSVGESSRRGDNVVVVYPYNKDYIISLASNAVEASLPAEQTYLKDSYGVGSSLMVASGDYKQFALKNVCGWLKLQFTGSDYVSKIVLRGNNGEQVAGDLLICADDASCILADASADINDDEVGGALLTESSILTEVTLNCDGGVALNSETPTAFYIALPPQTFEKGITIDVLWTDGLTMTKSTTNSLTIERNHIVPMASTPAQPTPPANEIWYTSSTGNIVTPYATDVFGATIVSNTYENDKGIIKFNGNITSIGSSAFIGCSALESITIPNSVTSIGNYAFDNCDAMTSVIIPDSVTSIGYAAFSECSALTSIYGKFASEDNRCLIIDGVLNSFAPAGLTTYTIPNSVTSIGNSAFYGCSALKSITIPNSVTEIGGSAFSSCSALTSINIPNSVTSIGNFAFQDCSALTSFYGKFASEDNRCLIIDGVLNSFAPAGLTTYTIPNSVTKIGEYAFYYCKALTSITIPNSVTSIGNYAFRSCSALTSITIPNSVTSIGNAAFYNCSALIRVDITDLEAWCKISFDGYYANPLYYAGNLYLNGELLENLVIPESITELKDYVFYNADCIKSVTIHNKVTSIGNMAFADCHALKSVTIGNSVTEIGYQAFYYCEALKRVNITDLATWCKISFGEAQSNPVYYARNLYLNGTLIEDLVIPNGVTMIGDRAFAYNDAIKSVTISDNVTSIGNHSFGYCNMLNSVTMGNGVKTLGPYAFGFCPALTSVSIGNSVTSIGRGVFCQCKALTSIIIPNSVTSIEMRAFVNCSALKEVYCKPTTPPTADRGTSSFWKAFDSNASDRKIYVPTESVDAYKAASDWSDYASDIEPYNFTE